MRASRPGAQLAARRKLAEAHLGVLAVDAPEAQGLDRQERCCHVAA